MVYVSAKDQEQPVGNYTEDRILCTYIQGVFRIFLMGMGEIFKY